MVMAIDIWQKTTAIILPVRFKGYVNRKLYISCVHISSHDAERISHQSRKQVNSATAPTATLLKTRPLVAELAPDVELADEELELALSAADEDAEFLLAVELEPDDREAADEAVSESVADASEVLLAVAEPLPVVEAGAATARKLLA